LRVELFIAAGLILLGARDVAVAGDDEGVQIAATCASCHGPGKGMQAIPAVTGLDEKTIVRAMQAFRASEAPSHVMHAVALSLTDEELASVAHYLATHGDKANSQ
jgi:cytochrome c553